MIAKTLQNLFGKKNKRSGTEEELEVWMDPVEYSQVIAVLEVLLPRHVLEWGSGGSTRALLERFDGIETYVSLEHNRAWYEKVKSKLDDPRLKLYHKAPTVAEPSMADDIEVYKAWMQRCEEDASVLTDYIEWPATLGMTFDFILVDGRARVHCLKAGWPLLRSGGVILIHDAQRTVYHPTIHKLGGKPVFLEPWHQGQICFIRKP